MPIILYARSCNAMNETEMIWSLFLPLYGDIKEEDEFYRKKPLLAHYTSLEVLEKILKTNEVWFSNPLFMNDLEEVRFGILNGVSRFKESDSIKTALGTEVRHKIFIDGLDHYINRFEQEHLLDTYVFCLSEHDPDNNDGLLSMWRGYGGNGKGAALVFDTSKLELVNDSPLIMAQVRYGSLDERLAWFDRTDTIFANILTKNDIGDDKVYLASAAIFNRILLFALFTKHSGFIEEKEWRVVYMSERDVDGKLKPMQDYFNGPRGVEPKLRLKIEPIDGFTAPDLSLDKILKSILLGPSISTPLAIRSVERMFDLIGKPELKERLVASTIPLRTT